MKSPIVRDQFLQKVELEEGLVAFECPLSHGHYIPLQNYWAWLNKQPERLEHLPAPVSEAPAVVENDQAKICPESGTIMLRYKVGHDFSFSIDRSMTGGVWFDQGEWEALKERQFHDEIHLIFTAPWQQDIQKAEMLKMGEQLLKDRFDAGILAELKDLKKRLAEHLHKEYAFAYLQS